MKKFEISLSKEQSNFIKLVGTISMLIDHLGAFLFPQKTILRIVGRIALPLFIFQVTVGFKRTSNFQNYLLRILFFGTISQVPFSLLWGTFFPLNIFFTFFLGLWILYFFEKKKYFLVLCLFLLSPFVEYSFYGTFLIFSFYFFSNAIFQFFSLYLANLGYFFISKNPLQMFSIFSFLFLLPKFQKRILLPQNFFYLFYPIHLTFIYFIKILLFV